MCKPKGKNAAIDLLKSIRGRNFSFRRNINFY